MLKLLLAVALLTSCGAAPAIQSPKGEEGRAVQPAPADVPPAPKGLDRARLLEDVRALAADEMEGRGVGTKGGAAARAYVLRRFTETGLKPLWPLFEQPFEVPAERGREGGARTGVNVVGHVRGRTHPDRLLVVTAHYDHLGVRGGKVYNGADDNASGVAVLLQLAAHFARTQPENSLVFAALDAEESGLLGAHALVRQLRAERREVALNVNLDMVSHSERGELYAAGTHHTPTLRPLLERIAARAPVRLLLGHDRPKQGQGDWTNQSDHYPFHKAGIPFVYFGVEDHRNYHKPSDDFETITQDFFVGAAETILEALKLLDAELAATDARRKA